MSDTPDRVKRMSLIVNSLMKDPGKMYCISVYLHDILNGCAVWNAIESDIGVSGGHYTTDCVYFFGMGMKLIGFIARNDAEIERVERIIEDQ